MEGASRVGGLVGWNEGSEVYNSYATGNVEGTGNYIGGLVGVNGRKALITNSYAKGNVEGEGHVGGLVASNGGEILNSYATGDTKGEIPHLTGLEEYSIGGLVGLNGGEPWPRGGLGDISL